MKRRNFLASLLGLAAAPILAKVPLLPAPIVGVDLGAGDATVLSVWRTEPFTQHSHHIVGPALDVIDMRELAKRELAKWFQEKSDALMFAEMTKDGPA